MAQTWSFPMSITVRFTQAGCHRWPAAPAHRAYLASLHRHLFFVEVTTPVEHHERQIEFHGLVEEAKSLFAIGETDSCESMAANLVKGLVERYAGRPFRVSVFEDNECGATVTGPHD